MAIHQRGQWSMHHLLPLMLNNTVSGRRQFVPMSCVVFRHCLGVLRSNNPSIAAFIMKQPERNLLGDKHDLKQLAIP
eukprot:11077585-Ditylum_brightwellii.AAC.1